MLTYPFLFKVETLHETTPVRQAGIIHGETYSDAMENLENYYGDTLIAVEYLFAMEDGPVIIDGVAFDNIMKGVWDCDTIL